MQLRNKVVLRSISLEVCTLALSVNYVVREKEDSRIDKRIMENPHKSNAEKLWYLEFSIHLTGFTSRCLFYSNIPRILFNWMRVEYTLHETFRDFS